MLRYDEGEDDVKSICVKVRHNSTSEEEEGDPETAVMKIDVPPRNCDLVSEPTISSSSATPTPTPSSGNSDNHDYFHESDEAHALENQKLLAELFKGSVRDSINLSRTLRRRTVVRSSGHAVSQVAGESETIENGDEESKLRLGEEQTVESLHHRAPIPEVGTRLKRLKKMSKPSFCDLGKANFEPHAPERFGASYEPRRLTFADDNGQPLIKTTFSAKLHYPGEISSPSHNGAPPGIQTCCIIS
mmetsp:Transcript_7911/g.14005  ORF Transcript_7911/g.14005 Transcript_7911/m.14005 type:complete len:245 (+) Transcript_7911:509-1243(+)